MRCCLNVRVQTAAGGGNKLQFMRNNILPCLESLTQLDLASKTSDQMHKSGNDNMISLCSKSEGHSSHPLCYLISMFWFNSRYANQSARFISGYDQGLSGAEMAWVKFQQKIPRTSYITSHHACTRTTGAN